MDGVHVILAGGVGTGNVGNDASVRTARQLLEAELDVARFTVATPFPQGALTIVPDPIVALRQEYTDHLQLRNLWRIAWALTVEEARRLRRLLELQRSASITVVTGTGIFDDFSEHPWNMPYALFTWTSVARLMRRPFAFLAVGAGPVNNRLSAMLFTVAARLATTISYRDTDSRDFMRRLGAGRPDATVCPDLVFAHPAPPVPPARPTAEHITIGLGVMAYGGWTTHGEGPVYETYVRLLASVVTALSREGHDIVFLVGQPVDQPVIDDVLAMCDAETTAVLTRRPPIEDFEDLLAAVGRTDIVIATRYHNVVAALMLHRPVISLSYAPKNAALLRSVGLPDFDRPVEAADATWVLDRLEELRRGRAGITPTGEKTIDTWADQIRTEVRRVLDVSAVRRTVPFRT